MARSSRAERRALVERMLVEDHARSDRSVARACGTGHSLVATVRGELVQAGRIARRPDRAVVDAQGESGRNANLVRQRAGEPGPALRHGAESEVLLAPLRARHLDELRVRFPDADEAILLVQAGRLARFQVLTEHLDGVGLRGLVRRDGNLRPAATLLARLEDAIERCHARLSGDGGGKRVVRLIRMRRIGRPLRGGTVSERRGRIGGLNVALAAGRRPSIGLCEALDSKSLLGAELTLSARQREPC